MIKREVGGKYNFLSVLWQNKKNKMSHILTNAIVKAR